MPRETGDESSQSGLLSLTYPFGSMERVVESVQNRCIRSVVHDLEQIKAKVAGEQDGETSDQACDHRHEAEQTRRNGAVPPPRTQTRLGVHHAVHHVLNGVGLLVTN